MLFSIALIVLLGLLVRWLCEKLTIPSLLGYLVLGILLGPSVFNLLDQGLLAASGDIRQVILIIILTRAGLSLNLKELKRVGRPAFLLSFLPATFEILGTMLIAPLFFDLTLPEAALLGAVLGAVSPAVVVPRMIQLLRGGYGTEAGIPQMLLAGSSLDDIYALVLFASFLSIVEHGGSFHLTQLFAVPAAILGGLLVGALVGMGLSIFFTRFLKDSLWQVLVMLAISMLFMTLEQALGDLPFSGILAVMATALALYRYVPEVSEPINRIYNKLWLPGEIFLFVLVGASVNISYATKAGWTPIFLILGVLAVRMVGVWLSVTGTSLTLRERAFCLFGYMPKATVQAAIGGVPLAMGLPVGELILTISVIAILVTAPLGAFGIDLTYRHWLEKDPEKKAS